ncbi:hypothetical protein Sango_2950800 [Sesamum angolense]|uniref:Helitron helicase-like domain-containing protein n=1 Tax=Sesamum angolense TaxID=2727404 RepID=A0AAE1VY50_9LAMI|nr:hypothetical protein Sango_2950800 [Sesamum angolense]
MHQYRVPVEDLHQGHELTITEALPDALITFGSELDTDNGYNQSTAAALIVQGPQLAPNSGSNYSTEAFPNDPVTIVQGPQLAPDSGSNYSTHALPNAPVTFGQEFPTDNGFNQYTQSVTAAPVVHVEGLKTMLDNLNPYVQVFRRARDALHHDGGANLHIRILHSRENRQHIRPTANEIAALIVGNDTNAVGCRDIIVYKNDGYLKLINENTSIIYAVAVSITFSIWFQHRESEGTTLLQGGRLFNQLAVDCYAAIEQQHLNYIKTHQPEMRADLYQGLEDAVVAGDTDASAVGRRIVLPSSFTGGPRNMMQHYQDAMAICRTIGTPDFFITFTCNPNWPKISQVLQRLPGQRTEDRPYIIARIFRMKHKQLMKLLREKKFFGDVLAADQDKPVTPEDIDEFICAEIPNKNVDPLAYETVERHWRAMTDDLQYRVRRELRDNSVHISDENLKEWGLHEIECILNRNGKTLGDFSPIPLPSSRSFGIISNRLIRLRSFAEWIDMIGEGNIRSLSFPNSRGSDWIEVPEEFLIEHGDNSLLQIIDSTYPNWAIFLLVICFTECRLSPIGLLAREIVLLDTTMTAVRLVLCGRFGMDEGETLLRTINQNNIVLACGVVVRDLEGQLVCESCNDAVNATIRFRVQLRVKDSSGVLT